VPPEGAGLTDANGAYHIGGLAPGEYRVAAWTNSPVRVLAIPEFLSQFDNRAAVVTLQEDQHATVDAPLIPQDAIDQALESQR
jgi:hypothetical protein